VVRFIDEGTLLNGETIIFDNIPAARFHAGCRIRFGPDKMLYITTGDAGERKLAQDLKSLHGKILRISPDGTIPADNPFPNSPVWSYGHRNPQGIDWFPGTGILWETEHGPSGFDGPGGGDEVNPASGVFIKSDKIPGFKNNFLFGCLRGNGIIRVIVDENDNAKVKSYEKFAVNYGRIRDITEGPDGFIYFSTSNRDGRGNVREGDDKIYRIMSK
jgi:glucose/arabinose dehydrogenase